MARAGASSAVPAVQVVRPVAAVPKPAQAPAQRVGVQAHLFGEVQSPPKVIPIPTLTPVRAFERERPARTAARVHPMPRPQRSVEAQQALDWGQPPSQAQLRPEEKISCNAPVAPLELRIFSALVDGAAVAVGTALIAGIYVFQGGDVQWGRGALLTFAALGAVVSAVYRTLWCLAGGDSPGMQCAGLRLVDFDGRRPDRRQRAVRQVASLLSWGAAGVGIAWALVDEEGLTWQDYISKTFPTLKDRSRL